VEIILSIPREEKEILNDFITESNEAIEKTELTLLKLEDCISNSESIDPGLINTVFRTFHSIKGSAGFLGLDSTNQLTHDAENLLDLIRKSKIDFKKDHIDIFLEVCDFLNQMLEYIGENYSESGFQGDAADLCSRLIKMTKQSTEKSLPEQNIKEKQSSKQTSAKPDEKITQVDSLISPEMATQFISESAELLDSLEQNLLSLEKNPQEMELVQSAFRDLHSLKGNAGFMNYKDIHSLAHKSETFLDNVRNGLVQADSDQISLILQILDFIRTAIDSLKAGHEPIIPGKHGLLDLMDDVFSIDSDESQESELNSSADEDLSINEEVPKKSAFEEQKMQKINPENANKKLADKPKVESPKKYKKNSPDQKATVKASEVIRVDVNKLDKLMDLVGEIVIAESMVSHHPDLSGYILQGFEKAVSYLQKNIRELQDLAMSMRLIPLLGIFGKMKRLVRDISAQKKNAAELITIGGDTEVDRSVIEHISDPLVHMLRNSIDHGIEMPEERKKNGKRPNGKIRLEAKRVGGEIWISVQDDGKGLDKEKIVAKAVDKGLISNLDEEVSDAKIYSLIFQPGLSTVKNVSNLSGRGVGMDVVLRNVEKIRGRIDVHSEQGKGTTMTLKIPLTTAIVDGMLTRVSDAIYAIPTLDIKESLQIDQSKIVNLIDGQEVINVRDNLIPVIRLHELNNIDTQKRGLEDGIVVVTEAAGNTIGFLVDEVIGQQQLVIKPVPDYFGKVESVSGCAILGNGEICLILDISHMVKIAETNHTV